MVAAELVAFDPPSGAPSAPGAAPESDWRQLVKPFTQANTAFAIFQLVSTLGLYVAGLAVMFWSLDVHYGLTLLLALPVGGLAVRLFVLFHDCCHGSFLPSARANEIVGMFLSPIVFTCFHHWRLEHNYHHATSGNLDKRGVGDVPTITLREFNNSSALKRFGYRLLRNPLLLMTVSAMVLFVLLQRFWGPFATRREKIAVLITDVAVVALWGSVLFAIGVVPVLLVMTPVIFVSAGAGMWLFYVQHQYPDAYWRHASTWSYKDAALKGSSFYDLPAVLQYFAGNIGYHHIHHLSPKVPNYRLRECHRAVPEFQVKGMSIKDSLACLKVQLIDDETLRVMGFGDRPRA